MRKLSIFALLLIPILTIPILLGGCLGNTDDCGWSSEDIKYKARIEIEGYLKSPNVVRFSNVHERLVSRGESYNTYKVIGSVSTQNDSGVITWHLFYIYLECHKEGYYYVKGSKIY
jgi:hypothetical protein